MAKCPCQKKKRVKKDSLCKKFSERYPVIFWMVWITLALIGMLTTIRLTTQVGWLTFLYIAAIFGVIIFFIVLAILYLNKFGEELQVELNGAIMGQINRTDRPTKTREDWKRNSLNPGAHKVSENPKDGCDVETGKGTNGGGKGEEPEFNCLACKAQGLHSRAEAEAAAAEKARESSL